MTARQPRKPGPRHPEVELGEALKGLLHSTGIHALMRHPELHEAWEAAAGGEAAACSRISAFRNGNLEIAVDSAALRMDLEFRRHGLLEDIRRRVSRPFVERITFIVKPLQDTDDKRRETARESG